MSDDGEGEDAKGVLLWNIKLPLPAPREDLAPLKAGDTVLLSGVVYTARDQAHKRMMEALDKGETAALCAGTAALSTTLAPRRNARARSSARRGPPPADAWMP